MPVGPRYGRTVEARRGCRPEGRGESWRDARPHLPWPEDRPGNVQSSTRVFDGREPSCAGTIVLPRRSHLLKGAPI